MGEYHAVWSPSSASRWMNCPGSIALEKQFPDVESEHAREGTAAHLVASLMLENEWLGKNYTIPAQHSNGVLITPEMIDHVSIYTAEVRRQIAALRAAGAEVEVFVEVAVPIGQLTGEEGATGTADCILIGVFADGRAVIVVMDLKFGRGVEVEAEGNPQLMIYLLGAMHEYSMLYEFSEATAIISQPRISEQASIWSPDLQTLDAFRHQVRVAADRTREPDAPRVPGIKQCKFCKAKSGCPELRDYVDESVMDGFEDVTLEKAVTEVKHGGAQLMFDARELGQRMDSIELIETYCKAIRAEVERRLLAQEEVPGFKLVEGRKGSRAWVDETEVEKTLKGMRLKNEVIYTYKVISPTAAEALFKKSNPKWWSRLVTMIGQSPGKPSVATADDKRAEYVFPSAEDFDVVSDESEVI